MSVELLEELMLEKEEKMNEAIEALLKDFIQIRTGRANPAILDRVNINYYGALSPIKQIAAISVAEGTQLVIKPFDKSTLKDIIQAIFASDLGLTPLDDGQIIRINLPQLTQERRKELAKEVSKLAENAKVRVRNVRRDANDEIKKISLPEDVEKVALDDVQKLTDKYIKKVEEEAEKKQKELLNV